ncbi:hypothetical protein JJL45_05190 [Tamlana sp. s12]|uniref:hypothetical protein n=1 Tax=Tamlana sp. s12 TaxID=1630406 RepID=UPI0007FF0D2F|nr:hypothetical protein [Tamlana sp. s12]OBQ56101.1 hypothetical protein VQ01_06870 [Tamlana sp. s12]QQY83386.1 hypothetical protein JJL45_05190 [Tamlana sp. s12]
MSTKTHVSLENENVEGRYASWIKQTIDLIGPKNLFLVLGRGGAKTSDIIADRSIDIMYDMPRSYSAFVADTYDNALRNIVPTLIEGWSQRKGLREGVHYVIDERPPSNFEKPYKPPQTYKHTISMWNGCFYNLGSLSQPTGLAGNSYQHIFVDEARNTDFEKLKKLFPAMRGDFVHFGHSPYFRGMTCTTDMPNVADGDHDWILNQSENMDVEQIKLALQCGLVLNDIKKKYFRALKFRDHNELERQKKAMVRWKANWIRARKDSTFFYVVSSLSNVDILTPGYFSDALKALGIEEFKTAVLSFKAQIKKGEKFYMNLGEHHFYDDGVIDKYYEKYAIGEEFKSVSLGLKYVQHNKPLDCGVDFGDMCSMVVGQERGNFYYCLKNFYTLAPESSKELAKKFLDFFEHHHKGAKVLNMYYDRSGNQYQKVKRDWANELKDHIIKHDGKSTGWVVNLMSRNQSVIYQEEEYNFAKKFMGEYYKELPKLKIDKYQCKELKSSLELTKTKIRKNTRTGSMSIHKDKSSESLALHLRPLYSTNFSDAFKYLIYRTNWVKTADRKVNTGMTAPSIV